MEKYSQFRDRGSGVAPFFPINSRPAGVYLPIYMLLFFIKSPFIIIAAGYFLFFQWLPLGLLFKKAVLWIILGIPGLWWIDLQVDGVRKGSLAKKHAGRVPGPSDIIASSFASPIDALYLAAIFDPIFTISYPHTEQVQVVSLLGAISRALTKPEEYPPKNAKMTDIKTVIANNTKRAVVIFPECTTTNGLGILPLSPSLRMVPNKTKIFPLHIRYAPADITTPIPRFYFSFLWNLLATPTHSIRVRIAKSVYNNTPIQTNSVGNYPNNSLERLYRERSDMGSTENENHNRTEPSKLKCSEANNVIDIVGESLARLGRVPRIGLTVKDKIKFIEAWKAEQ